MGRPAVARVRPARPADAPGIARVHVAVWREAYAGLVPTSFLDAFDVVTRTARWREHLAAPDASAAVAEAAGTVVGFARGGPTGDDPPEPAWELQALYLEAPHRGSGAADALLAAALGHRPASLWVFETNARARAFYARHGFEPDGTRAIDPGTGVSEVRLARSSSSPAA